MLSTLAKDSCRNAYRTSYGIGEDLGYYSGRRRSLAFSFGVIQRARMVKRISESDAQLAQIVQGTTTGIDEGRISKMSQSQNRNQPPDGYSACL